MILATYRLQLHATFGFRDAERITDYLADLGITHAYASPYRLRPAYSHTAENSVYPPPGLGWSRYRSTADIGAARRMGSWMPMRNRI